MFVTEEKVLKKIFQERSRGNLERAKKQALKGYDKFPGNYDISLELIQLCIELSDSHEAVSYMKAAARQNPGKKADIIQLASEYFYENSDPFLGSFIIESHIRNSDIDRVRQFLGRVSGKYIQDLIKRSQTKSDAMIQRGDTAGPSFTDNELLLGLLLAENGRFSEAVSPLGNALENCPEQAEKIGSVMLEFKRKLPDCAELEFNLGMASIYLDHPGKAESRFFNTLRMDEPPLDRILSVIEEKELGENTAMLRGEILLLMEREKEAIEAIREFLSGESSGWNEQPEDRIKQLFPAHVDRKSMVHDRLSLLPDAILYRRDTVFLLCDICTDLSKYIDLSNYLQRLSEISPESTGDIIEWIRGRENVMHTAPGLKLLAVLLMKSGEYRRSRKHFAAAAGMDAELTIELIRAVEERIDREGTDGELLKVLIDLHTRTGNSEKVQNLLQELREAEGLEGEEAAEMTAKVIENCGATLENILTALEFGAGRSSVEELAGHLTEFCRSRPDSVKTLAAEIGKLASHDSGLYPFVAELIGQAAKEGDLPDSLGFLQAEALLKSGEVERAVFSFDQILMFNEDMKYDVISCYENAVEDNPDNSTLLLALHQIYFDEEQYTEAARYLGRFLESDPSQIKDVISRFDQLAEKAQCEAGIWKQMLESALSIDHTSLAHQILERAVSALGESDAAPLHIYGARLYRRNRKVPEALKCLAIALTSDRSNLSSIDRELDRIIDEYPGDSGAMYLSGETSLRLGNEKKAAERMEGCVEISPEYTSRVRGRLLEALPSSVRPSLLNRLLGRIARLEGDLQSAVSFFSEAQKGDREELAALEPELREFLAGNPDLPELKRLYADTLRLAGSYREAVSQAEELLDSSGFTPGEAESFLRLITEEEPFQFEANMLLADILVGRGKTEESEEPAVNMLSSSSADPALMEEAAESLLPIHESSGDFLRKYALVKLRLGKEREGLEKLRRAAEISPGLCGEILGDISEHSWSEQTAADAGFLEADCLIESGEYGRSYRLLSGMLERFRDSADRILERAETLAGREPETEHFALAARAAAAAGDFRAARDITGKAEQVLGGDEADSIRIDLAGIADEQGMGDEASDIYAEVLERSSDRNRIYKLIERSLTGMAIKALEDNTGGGKPGGRECATGLIGRAIDFGRYPQAREILEASDLPEGKRLFNLGRIYMATDNPAMAVSFFSTCINRSSLNREERIEALYSLGRASEQIYDFARAASAFMKVLETAGEHIDAAERAMKNYTRCLEEGEMAYLINKTGSLNDEF